MARVVGIGCRPIAPGVSKTFTGRRARSHFPLHHRASPPLPGFRSGEGCQPGDSQSSPAASSTSLRAFAREQVPVRHGRRYDTNEILSRATGRPLDVESLLKHLRRRYLSRS